ncbi:MAG: hypothetical protein QY326_08675 [Bdellovibrionota bacterium]|nr:MAG: hypothetical protein QY326_08675 [Bdellovibrionota bacterium]
MTLRNNNVLSFVVLALVAIMSGGLNKASADIIRDSTGIEYWEGLGEPIFHHYGTSNKGNTPVYFEGNGQRLSTIGLVWGHAGSGGQPNQGDIESLNWRFMLFNGTSDFISDPHGESRPQGLYHLFDEPTNSSWRDIIGTTGGYNMRYAEFNVEALNLTLTQGTAFLASIQPAAELGGGIGGTLLAFANGGMGSQYDWYKSNWMGPNTLNALGAPYDYGAWKVTTVPAPGPGICMALGAFCLSRDRRRSRCCKLKAVASTAAVNPCCD